MDGKALTPQKPKPSTASPDREIAGLIARLLLHFWSPTDLSDSARAAMAEDWLSDLREFGPEIVSMACGDWRRAHSRRPTIADIRALCVAEQQRRREHDDTLSLPAPDRRALEERRRRRGDELAREGRVILNRWAVERGYPDWDAAQKVGQTYSEVIGSLALPKSIPMPRRSTAADFGAVATEYNPPPEAIQRGLEELIARGDVVVEA